MEAASSLRADLQGTLSPFLSDPTTNVFAVIDGALLDDCPAVLGNASLVHRSLYRTGTRPDLVAVGPWLIDLSREPVAIDDQSIDTEDDPDPDELADRLAADALAAYQRGDETGGGAFTDPYAPRPADRGSKLADVLEVSKGAPHGVVFWIGGADLTEPVMWRHVRTLNRVLLPARFVPKQDDDDGDVSVLLRHADGDVLADTLSVLDERQFARFLGPADAIVFAAPRSPSRSGSAVRRAGYPAGVPRQGAPMLHLSSEQMEAIEERRTRRFVRRLAQYLRETVPDRARDMTDAQLERYARARVDELLAYGVREEPPHFRWAFLQFYTGEELGRSDYVRAVMNDPRPNPTRSERVMLLFDRIHEQANRDAAGELAR